jgi:hypothetical protein
VSAVSKSTVEVGGRRTGDNMMTKLYQCVEAASTARYSVVP